MTEEVTVTTTRIINVTQQDIDTGVRGCGAYCPFARAFTRLFYRPGYTYSGSVSVLGEQYTVGEHRTASIVAYRRRDGVTVREYWELDEAASQAIEAYDTGLGMEPGQYTMALRGGWRE